MFHLWNTCFRFIFLLPLPLASSETIKRPVCVAKRVSCLVVVTKIIVIIISSNVVCLLLSRYKAFVFFVIIIVFSSVFVGSISHSHTLMHQKPIPIHTTLLTYTHSHMIELSLFLTIRTTSQTYEAKHTYELLFKWTQLTLTHL